MEKVYCEPIGKTMFKASCELRRRKKDDQGHHIIPECNGCPGPKPETEMEGKQMTKETKVEELPLCSRCGEKPCSKNTKSRKWSGGVGLCWPCYDIIRKEEKGTSGSERGKAPAKRQAKPSTSTDISEPAKDESFEALRELFRDFTDSEKEELLKSIEIITAKRHQAVMERLHRARKALAR